MTKNSRETYEKPNFRCFYIFKFNSFSERSVKCIFFITARVTA